jgi:hypothetical protein
MKEWMPSETWQAMERLESICKFFRQIIELIVILIGEKKEINFINQILS